MSNPSTTTQPGGSASHTISFLVPKTYVRAIKTATKRKDTDRSKWLREAIREKAAREGIAI